MLGREDPQDTVEVVLVFEKPDHIDTIEAMLRWFGESTLPERRRQ